MSSLAVERMQVEVEGSGDPVIMLHGLGGTSNTFWTTVSKWTRQNGRRWLAATSRIARQTPMAHSLRAPFMLPEPSTHTITGPRSSCSLPSRRSCSA